MQEMGERQRGEGNPSWKGGRHVDKHGYVWIRVTPDDEIAKAMIRSSTRHYVQEHRLLIAHLIGRPLESMETVHHINGEKSDNRIENLKLFASQSEHHRHLHLEACPNCGYALRQ
jgi:hypothetical protein